MTSLTKKSQTTPPTLSASASPARGCRLPGKEKDSQTPGLIFSSAAGSSLCWYDPDTFSLRTFQISLLTNQCLPYSQRLPQAGMMRSGHIYLRSNVSPPTSATDSGWSATRLWPTPTANQYEHSDVDALLARREECKKQKKNGNGFGLTTSNAVMIAERESWPTLCASQYRGTGPLGSKSHEHRLDRGYLDATVQHREQASGKLNPTWTEVLMGYPVGYTETDGPPVTAMLSVQSWLDGSWEMDIPRLTTYNNKRTKRLKALGNAVVPQCVEYLGGFIADHYLRSQNG